MHNLCDLSTQKISQVFMATSLNSGSELDDILLDSATTSHMFQKHLTFTNYLLENSVHTIVLHNILHIPHLASNIISLDMLQNKGATYHSSEDGLIITLQGDELLWTTLSRSLCHIQQTLVYPICKMCPDAMSSGGWHRYPGHKHPNTISKVSSTRTYPSCKGNPNSLSEQLSLKI
jgi:hypothetical protein